MRNFWRAKIITRSSQLREFWYNSVFILIFGKHFLQQKVAHQESLETLDETAVVKVKQVFEILFLKETFKNAEANNPAMEEKCGNAGQDVGKEDV